VAVDDVDENAKLAAELGGKIIKEPMDIPNTGRFAIIQDPTGATFATFRMAEGGHHG
jgi:predicted enzyme related to lactoylglutathione lyase